MEQGSLWAFRLISSHTPPTLGPGDRRFPAPGWIDLLPTFSQTRWQVFPTPAFPGRRGYSLARRSADRDARLRHPYTRTIFLTPVDCKTVDHVALPVTEVPQPVHPGEKHHAAVDPLPRL